MEFAAQNLRAVDDSAAMKRLDGQPLRRQLLGVYGGCSSLVFVVLIGLCAQLVLNTAKTTKDTSHDELTTQVVRNDGIILGGASSVLTETLHAGSRSLAQPIAVALFDVFERATSYSLQPTLSYADSDVSYLKP
eukprot:2706057-Prymnesium_polylepis.1